MKTFLALFLAFSILALSGNLYAKENKGADLVIQKRYGLKVKGELITVKAKSLLLMDSESGADVSVYINDVSVIKIMKKSKTWSGAGLGFLVGAVIGVMAGFVVDKAMDKRDLFWGPEHSALAGGAIGGLVGALGGGMIGTHISRPETIQIEGKTEFEIKEAMEYLRSKARVPDYN